MLSNAEQSIIVAFHRAALKRHEAVNIEVRTEHGHALLAALQTPNAWPTDDDHRDVFAELAVELG